MGGSDVSWLYVDLDKSGAIDPSTTSSYFPPESIGSVGPSLPNVVAQFVLVGGGITGKVDAAKPSMDLTLTGRVRFTGAGVGTCQTDIFAVPLSTTYNISPRSGEIANFSVYGDVAIPKIKSGGTCSSAVAEALNNGLRLDGVDQSRVWLYKTFVDPVIRGS